MTIDGAEAAPRHSLAPAGAASPPHSGTRLGHVVRGVLWSGLAALVAAVALGIWGDWGQLAAAFGRFSWTAIPIAVALTLVNYVLRFGKWHYYVRQIGARPTLRDSALIFTGGFALALTPGKSGELLKAYLLHRRCGAPAWKAAPISLAERATDGLAVLILAGVGLSIAWRSLWPALATVVAACAGCGALAFLATATRRQPEATRRGDPSAGRGVINLVLRRLRERPLVARLLTRLRESGDGAAAILDPRSLAVAVALGVVSWGAETVALWYTLVAFGVPATFELFGAALTALNAGTLAGALSLLPGGTGAAEATIAAVLVQHTDREIAAAATLIIRLCTLWFGATLGIGALLALRKSLVPPA